MAIKNDDLLYIQRPSGVDAGGYKITAGDLLNGASGGGSSVTVDETAPLNPAEGDLWWADSDVDEGGGRLYVWTGDEWVDTSLPGGGAGEFLSKTDDDTAAGEITFEKKTTHEAGVQVTGGRSDVTSGISFSDTNLLCISNHSETDAPKGQMSFLPSGSSGNVQVSAENVSSDGADLWNLQSIWRQGNAGDKNIYNFQSNIIADSGSTGIVRCYSADCSVQSTASEVYGFFTKINKSTATNGAAYAFYAEGDAPNYFAGLTQHAGGVSATGGTSIRAIFDTTTPNWGGNQSAKFYASGNSDQIGHQGFTANDIGPGADGNAVGFYYQENTANSTHNNYGFKANVFVNAGAGENYAFYSEGDAPSYFKGNVTSDGTIGFSGKFSLRMDTDDPSAFQTTYSTDEEGNQVENQEYIGTTEDLLSIIKDLRARVTQLEADHATMMNNNGGGY
jgi:hypothetical protein